jgi:two-component system sensor histidine kinase YesM
VLQVIDDGVGTDAAKLNASLVKGRLHSPAASSTTSGLGIQNVNHRIQLNFGERFGLSFDSELDEGTTATLRMPELMDDKGE